MTASDTAKRTWTILELITWGTTYLTEKGLDDARLNIELLIADILHLQRIQLYTNFDRPLSGDELSRFKALLKRRLAHEPLQYILGATEFMGFTFTVDRRVLIPRPDTEVLVESVIQKIKDVFPAAGSVRVLDVGTGSGCIAVSLAKLLPNVSVTAIDVSSEALDAAKSNAENNGVQESITFLQTDVLLDTVDHGKFHCLVSNPPYISDAAYGQLPAEVKDFEPAIALAARNDGLTFFKEIAAKTASCMREDGFVAVEHAFDQSESVQKIFRKAGLKNITPIKDYSGNFRCVIAEK